MSSASLPHMYSHAALLLAGSPVLAWHPPQVTPPHAEDRKGSATSQVKNTVAGEKYAQGT